MEINEDRYTRHCIFSCKIAYACFPRVIFPRDCFSECVNNVNVIIRFAEIWPSDQILSSLTFYIDFLIFSPLTFECSNFSALIKELPLIFILYIIPDL